MGLVGSSKKDSLPEASVGSKAWRGGERQSCLQWKEQLDFSEAV